MATALKLVASGRDRGDEWPSIGSIHDPKPSLKVKFWGVRGSIAAPMTNADIYEALCGSLGSILRAPATNLAATVNMLLDQMKKGERILSYGGNTSCVEVSYGDRRLILDMGTGLRPLGNSLMPAMFANKVGFWDFLVSHVHWDHIQGLPFFGPLYINKESKIKNYFRFWGGNGWQGKMEDCLAGQMDPPLFPVNFKEIAATVEELTFNSVHDRKQFGVGPFLVTCRKLNHPQETYGYRIETPDGKVVVYTTDQEPYDPAYPDPGLLDLWRQADLIITDCQYSQDVYNGIKGGLCRHGWGHSYPKAVAQAAVQAKVKVRGAVVLFHHDPMATAEDIEARVRETATEMTILDPNNKTIVTAAYEGMELTV